MRKPICAFAPATIANVNVGFDILGISLTNIGDKVEVVPNHLQENRITQIDNNAHLPKEADKNCCSVVIDKMQQATGSRVFVDIKIKKGFPSGSGLGSSSASSAAAAFAYNQLLDKPMETKELVAFAAEGERVACGAPHMDNVAPALMGGIVLLHEKEPISLPLKKTLYALSFFPNIEINTSASRSIVSKNISLSNATKQVSSMGAFVHSLYQNDWTLMANSMRDYLVEPSRKILIPYFEEMRANALSLGAITFGISGSGPSVFALAPSLEIVEKINLTFNKIYHNSNIKTLANIEKIKENNGAKLCNYND